METLSLAGAILFFSLQFLFTKRFEKGTDGKFIASCWAPALSGFFLCLFCLLLNRFQFTATADSLRWGVLYALSGLCCSVCTVTAMNLGKISAVTLFSLLGGMVVPFFYGIWFLKEELTWLKGIGILIMLLSLVPGLLGDKSSGKKTSPLFAALCFGVFFTNGLVSVFTKQHQISQNPAPERDFLILASFTTLLIAGLLLSVLAITRAKKEGTSLFSAYFSAFRPFDGTGKSLGLVFFIMLNLAGYAVMNGVGNLCSLTAARTMDSSLQFPVLSAGVVILTALLSRIFFGEKLTKYTCISIITAAAGILLFLF